MARLPSAPTPRTLTLAGWIVTAEDVMLASTDAVEEGGAIGFTLPLPGQVSIDEFLRRAAEAAALIHRSIVSAAGQAMAADARVTPGHQAGLARDIAGKARGLIRAIQGDSGSAPSDMPAALALMMEHVPPASKREQLVNASVIERMMNGSAWWAQVVEARTDQEAHGQASAAVFAAMKMLPEALGMLVALADAAEQAAEGAAARDRRDGQRRGGRRIDPFAAIVMRGTVSAYHRMFDAWPEGKPDKLPKGRPDARAWTRAVLQAAFTNLTSGAVRGDSAFVAERVGRITMLAEASLGDHVNAAVFAENQPER